MKNTEETITLTFTIKNGEIVKIESLDAKKTGEARTIGDLEFLGDLKHSYTLLTAQNSPVCVVVTSGGQLTYL